MKKVMTVLVFVLACCFFVNAQSTMSSDSTAQDKMQDSKTMGKKMSMTGCIAEKMAST